MKKIKKRTLNAIVYVLLSVCLAGVVLYLVKKNRKMKNNNKKRILGVLMLPFIVIGNVLGFLRFLFSITIEFMWFESTNVKDKLLIGLQDFLDKDENLDKDEKADA